MSTHGSFPKNAAQQQSAHFPSQIRALNDTMPHPYCINDANPAAAHVIARATAALKATTSTIHKLRSQVHQAQKEREDNNLTLQKQQNAEKSAVQAQLDDLQQEHQDQLESLALAHAAIAAERRDFQYCAAKLLMHLTGFPGRGEEIDFAALSDVLHRCRDAEEWSKGGWTLARLAREVTKAVPEEKERGYGVHWEELN